MIEADFERAKAYAEVKNLIDDFHRSLIEDVLSNSDQVIDREISVPKVVGYNEIYE